MMKVTEKACDYIIDGNERSLLSNTWGKMCIQPFCLAAVYTAAFALSSWASVELKCTPTRSCCCTRLALFSGWASQPAGDNTSSLLPSCTHTICSNLYSYHLQQLAWVKASCYPHNWRSKDPQTHDRHTYTCGCYSCVCHSLRQQGE